MTTASGVAVIATQVARTDRRALSEAWYSALHLAHGNPAAPAGSVPRAAPTLAMTPVRVVPAHATREKHEPATLTAHSPKRRHDGVPVALDGERRRPACATSRRIERAVTTLATRWNGAAAQTVDVAGGRVRLLVRADRGATRIVAVCPPRLREPVERALANARFALAAGGLTVAH